MDTNYPENYNSETLVELWTNFVDWKKRREGEEGFLVKTLNLFNCKKVFDACLGDGADSIHLIQKGFNVTSNDIDRLFIKKAKENAKEHEVSLEITKYNWLDIDKHIKPRTFDAVLCMGNSLTYLFNRESRMKTLRNFFSILKKDGVLVIDERNYQYILDNKEDILENNNFRYSGKYVYCGNKVHGKPIEIFDDEIRMEYADEETGKKGYLILYPFKKGELELLLKDAGFGDIEVFSDFKKGYNAESDFHQYVCRK